MDHGLSGIIQKRMKRRNSKLIRVRCFGRATSYTVHEHVFYDHTHNYLIKRKKRALYNLKQWLPQRFMPLKSGDLEISPTLTALGQGRFAQL